MAIPRRIIQTHRSEELARSSRDTWTAHHPDYAYVFFDHPARRQYIADHYADLLPVYDRLPHWVQQTDVFRYAVIHAEGGLYADADTLCCARLDSYADCSQDTLITGFEMVPDHYRNGMEGYAPNYPAPHQILNWTFAASPGHPVFAVLLRRIAWHLSLMTDAQLAEWSRNDRFTLQITGPILFTQVCNEFLSGTREGRIDVLPRMAWGSWPFEHEIPALEAQIKVKHLFEGSWKARPRPASAPAATGVRYGFKL